MKKSPIEDGFLQAVWDDILKASPGMDQLPSKAKFSVELGFLYGATIMSGVMGAFTRAMPALSEQAQAVIRAEANAMMDKLRARVLAEAGGVGASPITGFPLDTEFKL